MHHRFAVVVPQPDNVRALSPDHLRAGDLRTEYIMATRIVSEAKLCHPRLRVALTMRP